LKKPATLAFGLEETPPASVIWISAIQHVGVCAIFMVYPLIIADQAKLPPNQVTNLLQLGFIVLALATVLQALPRGPVGSRYLAPSIYTGIYLAPSLLAVKIGGLPLMWGMTIFAGLSEIVLSRAWSRIRPFIPPESAGLVIVLVGFIIGLAAVRVMLEDSASGALTATDGIVAGCALAVMAGLNVWNRGRLKLFCILIGMIVGYFVAAAAGLLTWHDISRVVHRPLLAIPTLRWTSWTFDMSLVVPFAVTGLAAAMNTTAVLTTYQRLTDADWTRPDMASIGRGVLSDGIAGTLSGLLGTYGLSVSSANVGLVAATGVVSRVIAFAIAALLAVAALQPALIGILTIMPRPVMAAPMIFTSVFIMISGVQIIATRVLDGRRTLVIGMGILSFLVDAVDPNVFNGVPQWVRPLVSTPLVLATLVALSLNLLFRIGIRRRVEMSVGAEASDSEKVIGFIEHHAGVWGARRDVTSRVEFAVQQATDLLLADRIAAGPVNLAISFDEFVIDVVIAYHGVALDLPVHAPSHDEIIETENGHRRLAGYLIRQHADRVESRKHAHQIELRMHFDH
jgi:xanthine permease XanP